MIPEGKVVFYHYYVSLLFGVIVGEHLKNFYFDFTLLV